MTDVIVHCGSNNLPETKSADLVNSIGEALHTAQQAFPNATVYYSPIIPKKVTESVRVCDKVNGWVKKLCAFSNYNFIQTRGLFVRNGDIRWDRLSNKDRIHLNRSGVAAMGRHLKYMLHSREEGCPPPPYSPS